MSGSDLLVLGIGNPDRGDDGIGIRVAEALRGTLPPGVMLRTRTGDMLGLLEDWDGYAKVICIDAAAPMGEPGRIHRIDAMRESLPAAASLASSHGIGLAEALALALTLGQAPETLIVFAIEGAGFEAGEPMTPAVLAAVETTAAKVRAEVAQLRAKSREAAHA